MGRQQRGISGDPIDRAHLTGMSRPTPPIHRRPPSALLEPLVQRYWIPVWSLPEPQVQSTLQHPCCLLVVSNTYARFYGVTRGLSTVTLEGAGWAVGTMFTPAAGRLLLGGPVSAITDTHVDLDRLETLDGDRLAARIRSAMVADPASPEAHTAAIAVLEEQYTRFVPIDEQGEQVNRVVAWVLEHPEVTRVSEVAEAMGMNERSLQRLVERRLGISPKWLIQRRRLHDAVQRLKAGTDSLATLAAELGHSDQAAFTKEFKLFSGRTPGDYLRDQPAGGTTGGGPQNPHSGGGSASIPSQTQERLPASHIVI